ncbi:DUF998 domain-containing protein [Microbacterium sp. APC 3898]|uniref:DUF998 domain-containing protein n=2 Tax=Planococcus TaxID=1372 RepID=A0ABT7ZF64_9BACL|nr:MULTISPECIES: DUF998 domain-containing protein [Terrabacteria group]MBD8013492.1 DUF998 domain-containing protein [Planococcus wigleyi]MDN3425790.1 DUF998 domain-containing protein [Planococcus sp. APC 4016]MDN3437384.1 DUF998 domain-containing protein [Planococcus sp. APC 3900]MDN3500578.1 DUF998 domain-containing protein [Microbacterium sp. APC 3898]
MKFGTQKNYWQFIALSGAIAALVYISHVVMGGVLWVGYSHVKQTISELTGNGAPDAEMLRIFTLGYGILAVLFSIALYVLFRKYKVDAIARFGALLLLTMHTASLVGYGLFPLEQGGEVLTFGNFMHLAITAIVVIATVGALFAIGYGLWLTKNFKGIGVFTLVCAVVIVLAGIATPIVLNYDLPYAGLVERVTVFTLQLWTFVLSLYLYRLPKIIDMEVKRMGLVEVYKEP